MIHIKRLLWGFYVIGIGTIILTVGYFGLKFLDYLFTTYPTYSFMGIILLFLTVVAYAIGSRITDG